MNDNLKEKLKKLPKGPGVYFHKNLKGEIIYVGKAAVLSNRVRQYFQKSRMRGANIDPKTDALVAEIADVDWMSVETELDALFLEAEMIRRYMPKYNILLRDDKSMLYIRIDYHSDYPTVTTTRRPLDDGAKYFGPYLSALSVRQALKLLRRAFPYATSKTPGQKRANLHFHLGLDPGLEEAKTSLTDYRANLRRLIAIIEGKRTSIEQDLEREMKRLAKASDFEAAAKVRNQIFTLKNIRGQVIFSDKEFLDISKDHALNELKELFGLREIPKRVEAYDVSHMQGSDVVASMVVFTNGVSNKSQYRKFKTKINHNDDFYNMRETISRRLSPKNQKSWGLPNLVLIDGGKGQLEATIKARDQAGLNMPFIGLAKREEQIVVRKPSKSSVGSGIEINSKKLQSLTGYMSETNDFVLINLPATSNLVKLLQRLRDESHRFAVSYHSVLKQKRQTASLLDEIPSIGPKTRKKLIRTFGSLRGVASATREELVKSVGQKKATTLIKHLGQRNDNEQTN